MSDISLDDLDQEALLRTYVGEYSRYFDFWPNKGLCTRGYEPNLYVMRCGGKIEIYKGRVKLRSYQFIDPEGPEMVQKIIKSILKTWQRINLVRVPAVGEPVDIHAADFDGDTLIVIEFT